MFLTKYARRPLHFFGVSGLFLFIMGFSICGYLSYLWFAGHGPIGNRPLLFLGILLILSGMQFISIGLIGELITNKFYQNEDTYFLKKKLA